MFVAVLLYSSSAITDDKERALYSQIISSITTTQFLKKYLRLICIDNEYAKTILKKNKITHWPVFVVTDNSKTTVYELQHVNTVFHKVHERYQKFYSNSEKVICPQIKI